MSNCKSAKILISLWIANSLISYKNQVDKSTIALYKSAVGVVIWLAIYACLDLAYSVKIFSWFCNNPGLVYIELVKHVLQYVSRILDLSLKFDRKANILDDIVEYINSKFAWSKTNRKLTGGYIFMLAGAVISHLFKFQSIFVLLTCKTDYIIMYELEK